MRKGILIFIAAVTIVFLNGFSTLSFAASSPEATIYQPTTAYIDTAGSSDSPDSAMTSSRVVRTTRPGSISYDDTTTGIVERDTSPFSPDTSANENMGWCFGAVIILVSSAAVVLRRKQIQNQAEKQGL